MGKNHYASTLASFLSQYSQAIDLLFKNIVIGMRQKQSKGALKLTEFPETYAMPFITHLDSIRQKCEKIGAPLIIFTFCTKFRRKQTLEQRLANMNTALYYMPWMSPDAFFYTFELFNRKMFEFAQKHKNVYIDFA